MSGFFGVASKEDCIFDLFFGTDVKSTSHLGSKACRNDGLSPKGRLSSGNSQH